MTALARIIAAAEDVGHTLAGWVGTIGGFVLIVAVAFKLVD